MTMLTLIKDDKDNNVLPHLIEVLLLLPLQQLHGIEEASDVVAVRNPPEVQLLLQHVHEKAKTQDAHNQIAQSDPHEENSPCEDVIVLVCEVQGGGLVQLHLNKDN